MWWDILKNAKLSGKTEGETGTLDTSRIKIKTDEDDKCNKQLQAWAGKLKNYTLLLKERYYDNELLVKHFTIKEESIGDSKKSFEISQKSTSKKYDYGFDSPLYEATYYKYKPVPEKVACKAIDMLKKSTTGDFGSEDTEEIDGYEIIIFNYHDYQANTTALAIIKDKIESVMIGWSNGEDLSIGNDSFKEDFKRETSTNVYRVSGYYDTQEFGYSWWK